MGDGGRLAAGAQPDSIVQRSDHGWSALCGRSVGSADQQFARRAPAPEHGGKGCNPIQVVMHDERNH